MIFFFFLEGYKNCRVGIKKTGSVGLAETQVFLGLMFQNMCMIQISVFIKHSYVHINKKLKEQGTKLSMLRSVNLTQDSDQQ